MADWAAVRAAIGGRLETIDGLRVSSYAPDQTPPPLAVVVPGPGAEFWRFSGTMGPTVPVDFTAGVELFVKKGTDRTGQEQLDAYLSDAGPSSIFAAIEGDRTLGGVVAWCICESAGNYTIAQLNGIDVYAVKFNLSGSTE